LKEESFWSLFEMAVFNNGSFGSFNSVRILCLLLPRSYSPPFGPISVGSSDGGRQEGGWILVKRKGSGVEVI